MRNQALESQVVKLGVLLNAVDGVGFTFYNETHISLSLTTFILNFYDYYISVSVDRHLIVLQLDSG